MEQIESYGLECIQRDLLQALIMYDNICRKNKIEYSLHGGTLLGAERNHKFIPWDDDADVSMTRAEYRKFQQATKDLPDGYSLDEKTMWLPRMVMRTKEGVVCVDILVWDYISSSRVVQKLKITLIRFFQGMMKTHIEYERFNFVNRCLLFATNKLGRLVSAEAKRRWFSNLCENAFTGDKKYIHRSNDAYLGVSYIFDSDYMNRYKDIEFEGHYFRVNERYHEFLERNYGADYLIPPPKEQRIPGHEKIRKDL